MEICHPHNLATEPPAEKPYGIGVSLSQQDSFLDVIGDDWENYHWFANRQQRDQALAAMQSEHLYSRRGDRPTTVFRTIDPEDEPQD